MVVENHCFLSFSVNVLSLQQALTAMLNNISIIFTASPDGEMVSKVFQTFSKVIVIPSS